MLNAADVSQLRSAQACTSVAHALEELVLNALDAQATEVHAVLDVTGFSMTVRDNGTGMSVDELALVGDRHATSKLATVEELQELVSFGYRGQALHALAAASLLEIVSRRPGTLPSATHATVLRSGQRLHVGPAQEVRAPGTTVSVRELLVSRPVQRKRLQRPGAAHAELEAARLRLVRLAVAHPHVAFRLHDASRSTTVLNTSPTSEPLTCLARLHGGALPPMTPLLHDDGEYNFEGYVALPPAVHRSRELQLVYVNRRPLSRRSELPQLLEAACARLQAAVTTEAEPSSAAHASAAHAAFVVFLRCAPSCYDDALEPDRSDVLFADFGAVATAALAALAHCFSAHCAALAPEAVARILAPLVPADARRSGRAAAAAAALPAHRIGGFAWAAAADADADYGSDSDEDQEASSVAAAAKTLLDYGESDIPSSGAAPWAGRTVSPPRRLMAAATRRGANTLDDAAPERASGAPPPPAFGALVPRAAASDPIWRPRVPLSLAWPALHASHGLADRRDAPPKPRPSKRRPEPASSLGLPGAAPAPRKRIATALPLQRKPPSALRSALPASRVARVLQTSGAEAEAEAVAEGEWEAEWEVEAEAVATAAEAVAAAAVAAVAVAAAAAATAAAAAAAAAATAATAATAVRAVGTVATAVDVAEDAMPAATEQAQQAQQEQQAQERQPLAPQLAPQLAPEAEREIILLAESDEEGGESQTAGDDEAAGGEATGGALLFGVTPEMEQLLRQSRGKGRGVGTGAGLAPGAGLASGATGATGAARARRWVRGVACGARRA